MLKSHVCYNDYNGRPYWSLMISMLSPCPRSTSLKTARVWSTAPCDWFQHESELYKFHVTILIILASCHVHLCFFLESDVNHWLSADKSHVPSDLWITGRTPKAWPSTSLSTAWSATEFMSLLGDVDDFLDVMGAWYYLWCKCAHKIHINSMI